MMKLFISTTLLLFLFLFTVDVELNKCYTENWLQHAHYPGWSLCDTRRNYLSGLYRKKDDADKKKSGNIFLIEQAKCCMMSDDLETLVHYDTRLVHNHFDGSNIWAACREGYFLNGLYRSNDVKHNNKLSDIKNFICSKPKDHPDEWGHCYENDISHSFDVEGWSGCKAGYFLTALYKSSCEWINCLDKMKCCTISKNYTPSRYHYHDDRQTWKDARTECLKIGGDLLTIQSKVQNDYIATELKKRKMISTWIGLNDIEKESHFTWSNPIKGNTFMNWNKESSNEPNGGRRENCGELIPGSKYNVRDWKGMWNDKGCSDKYPYVCQVVEKKIDGGWSSWSSFTPCSVTCGFGHRSRHRDCNNPVPKHGGKICTGGMHEEEETICIKPDCP